MLKRILVGVGALLLTGASYASAQPAEGFLGRPLPQVTAKGPARPAPAGVRAGLGSSAGMAQGLSRVQADGRNATRGAAETRLYQRAAPSVVLVIAGDSFGSGALISADGQIITNAHVVGDLDEVGVVFKPAVEGAAPGKADLRRATVIKRDEVADLALIKVVSVPAGLTPLTLGSLSSVQVGADVSAIGHPDGQSWTFTRGIVSQVRRDYDWNAKGDEGVKHRASVIQTQTPINPGNSGGPLLDESMQIVGINSFVSIGAEGLNFAVSADDVKAFLASPGDRRARPVQTASASKAADACEPVSLSEEYDKKRKGHFVEMDTDCDKKGDAVLFVSDKKSDPWILMMDTNDDDKIDITFFDVDHDNDFEYALYDTDGDEEPDVRGEFRNGENEPYQMTRLD